MTGFGAEHQRVVAEHEQFAHDDAAYLLGGLAPADRQAYERHLAECPVCQLSVAELADLPAVLEQVDPAGLDSLDAGPVPDTLLPRLLAEAGRHRSRRTLRTAGTGFLVACLLALAVFGGVRIYQANHQPKALALQSVAADPSGIYATVTLTGDNAKPRIELDCGYHDQTGVSYPTDPPSYTMVVFNRSGMMRTLGSWSPQPGEDVEISRDSPWRRQALAKIEVADSDGTVVLRLNL